jgi:hypothetical protein
MRERYLEAVAHHAGQVLKNAGQVLKNAGQVWGDTGQGEERICEFSQYISSKEDIYDN